jgi:hypothetical protein
MELAWAPFGVSTNNYPKIRPSWLTHADKHSRDRDPGPNMQRKYHNCMVIKDSKWDVKSDPTKIYFKIYFYHF